MKAVVLETKDGYCAVLKDDGTVEKIRAVAEVGDEIDMSVVRKKTARISRFPLRYVATAASVALVAVASGYLSFVQDYSFVSVDVNPSVEYSLNRMDRVVHVNAFDKAGESLAASVKQVGVEGDTLDEAVDKTAVVLQKEGYVDASDDVVLVSVSSRSKEKGSELEKQVVKRLKKDEVPFEIKSASIDDRKKAKKSGISTPRYVVVKEAVGTEEVDQAAIEVAKAKSTSELLAIVEEADEAKALEKKEQEAEPEKKADEEIVDVCEEIHEDEPEVVEEDTDSEISEEEKQDESEEAEAAGEETAAEEEQSEEETVADEQEPIEEQQGELPVVAPKEAEIPQTEVQAVSPSTVPVSAVPAEEVLLTQEDIDAGF